MKIFRTLTIIALVAIPAFLPAGIGLGEGGAQPLVICADGYADGDYIIRVKVLDGVATNLGFVSMVTLAGEVVGEPTEPTDPEEPTNVIGGIRATMSDRGRLDQFDTQHAALKKLTIPGSATTLAGARDSLLQPLSIIVPPSDQPSWKPWYLPTVTALNEANTLEEVVTVWTVALQKLEG